MPNPHPGSIDTWTTPDGTRYIVERTHVTTLPNGITVETPPNPPAFVPPVPAPPPWNPLYPIERG